MKIEKNGWEFSVIDNGYGGDYAGGTKDVGLLEVAIFEPEIDPILGTQKSEIKGWMTQEDVEDLKRTFETDPVMAYRRIGGEWKESWQKGGESYFVEWGYDLDYDFAEIDDIDDAKQKAESEGGNVYLNDKLVYSVIPSIKKDPTNDKSKFIVSNNLMGVESIGTEMHSINQHIKWIRGDKHSTQYWSCNICDEIGDNLNFGATVDNVKQHLKTHGITESKSDKCSYCGKGRMKENPEQCSGCGDVFSSEAKANEGMGEIDPTQLKKIVTDNFDTRGSGMFMFCNHCNHMIENKFGVDIGSFMTDINTQRKVLSHMMDYHVKELMVKEGFYQGLHGYVDAKCKTCGGLEFGSIEVFQA